MGSWGTCCGYGPSRYRFAWAIALRKLHGQSARSIDCGSSICAPAIRLCRYRTTDHRRGRLIERFARAMQDRQQDAGPFLRSVTGKARGQPLRLSLVLEFLWWCGEDGAPRRRPGSLHAHSLPRLASSVTTLSRSQSAFYGTTAATARERNAATLARWILPTRAAEVHIRHLQRHVRLAGLRNAAQIREAAGRLVRP